MQIVINIDSKVYNFIKNRGHIPYGVNIANEIASGTPFDKIRAEIEAQRKEASNKHSEDDILQAYYDGLNDGLKDARYILDKYKVDSEED